MLLDEDAVLSLTQVEEVLEILYRRKIMTTKKQRINMRGLQMRQYNIGLGVGVPLLTVHSISSSCA